MAIFDKKGNEIHIGDTLKFIVFNKYVRARIVEEDGNLICIDSKGKRYPLHIFRDMLVYPDGVLVDDE